MNTETERRDPAGWLHQKSCKITSHTGVFASFRRSPASLLCLRAIFALCICTALSTAPCQAQPEHSTPAGGLSNTNSSQPAQLLIVDAAHSIIAASRARISLGEIYDPSYYSIAYPGGDVPNDRGVCTDVVIRAYRQLGIDFQQLIHEDMRKHFSAYPKLWGNPSTDRNIDHRRVPNIETFLTRQGAALTISERPLDYRPGDLVSWRLDGGQPHIGIVSDRYAADGKRPLIIHNIGAGTSEEDMLFRYPINGHFRYFPKGR